MVGKSCKKKFKYLWIMDDFKICWEMMWISINVFKRVGCVWLLLGYIYFLKMKSLV